MCSSDLDLSVEGCGNSPPHWTTSTVELMRNVPRLANGQRDASDDYPMNPQKNRRRGGLLQREEGDGERSGGGALHEQQFNPRPAAFHVAPVHLHQRILNTVVVVVASGQFNEVVGSAGIFKLQRGGRGLELQQLTIELIVAQGGAFRGGLLQFRFLLGVVIAELKPQLRKVTCLIAEQPA